MTETVTPPKTSMSRSGSSVTIWVRHPPLNLLVQSVRTGLATCLTAALNDPAVDRIVLRSAVGCFAAGADVTELREAMDRIAPFSDPEPAPTLRSLVAMIRGSDKRTIAVIEGFALGGGFELALACDTRFAHAAAHVGLPEVKLGLLPGSGGTQMLARLAGIRTALDLCTSGRHVSSSEALRLGLVDAVFGDEAALDELTARPNTELGPRRRSWQTLQDEISEEWFSTARLNAVRSDPGFLAPLNVIKSIGAAAKSVEQGLAEEWRLWLELFWHAQREGRFYAFFASRDIGRASPGDKVSDITLQFDASARDRLGIADTSVGTSAEVILVTADGKATSRTGSRPWLWIVDSLEAAPWSNETGRIVVRRGSAGKAIVEVVLRDAKEMPIALGALKCFRRSGFAAFASKTPRVSVVDTLHMGFDLTKAEIKRNAPTLNVDAMLAKFGFVAPARIREVEPVDPFAPNWNSDPVIGLVVGRLDAIARRLVALGAVTTTEITDVAAVHALGFPAHAGGPSFALGKWKDNV